MTSKRNIGLDFCRIGGMLGIVIRHILGAGGVLSAGGDGLGDIGPLGLWRLPYTVQLICLHCCLVT